MAFDRDHIMAGNRREQVRLAGNAVTPPAARDWMRRPSPWRIWKLFAMSNSASLSFFVIWSVITLCRRCARTRLNIASAACFCRRPTFRARNIAMASRTSFASSSRPLRCTRACKRSVRLSHRQWGITDRGLGITEGGRGRPSPPSRLTPGTADHTGGADAAAHLLDAAPRGLPLAQAESGHHCLPRVCPTKPGWGKHPGCYIRHLAGIYAI